MNGSNRLALLLGLGNPILSDDAVGLAVARRVRARLAQGRSGDPRAEVVEAEIAGFDLVELLAGRPAAVIVDALISDEHEPGAVLERTLADFRPTTRLATMHQVDLPTALALGEELGRPMPPARRLWVLAVVAQDAQTFGETLSPAVEAAVAPAAERALALLRDATR